MAASKRPRLDGNGSSSPPDEREGLDLASRTRVVLTLCGSMSPITFLHLRMFGEYRSFPIYRFPGQ